MANGLLSLLPPRHYLIDDTVVFSPGRSISDLKHLQSTCALSKYTAAVCKPCNPIGIQTNDWKWCISPDSSPPPPPPPSGIATVRAAAAEAQPRTQWQLTELQSSSRVRCSANACWRARSPPTPTARAGASSVCALSALCHRTAPSRFAQGRVGLYTCTSAAAS